MDCEILIHRKYCDTACDFSCNTSLSSTTHLGNTCSYRHDWSRAISKIYATKNVLRFDIEIWKLPKKHDKIKSISANWVQKSQKISKYRIFRNVLYLLFSKMTKNTKNTHKKSHTATIASEKSELFIFSIFSHFSTFFWFFGAYMFSTARFDKSCRCAHKIWLFPKKDIDPKDYWGGLDLFL